MCHHLTGNIVIGYWHLSVATLSIICFARRTGATYSNQSGWVCVSQSRFTWVETAGNLFGGVGAKVCLCRVAHLQTVCGLNTRATQMGKRCIIYTAAVVAAAVSIGDRDANIPHGASVR